MYYSDIRAMDFEPDIQVNLLLLNNKSTIRVKIIRMVELQSRVNFVGMLSSNEFQNVSERMLSRIIIINYF